MLKPNDNGGLFGKFPLYKKVHYDMSNKKVLCQCDGSGAISKYSIANRFETFIPNSFYTSFSINNEGISGLVDKTVSMIGRTQHMSIDNKDVKIWCNTFLDEDTQAIFQQYNIANMGEENIKFRIDFGFLFNMESIYKHTKIPMYSQLKYEKNEWGYYNKVCDGWGMSLISNNAIELREVQDIGAHYSVTTEIQPGKVDCINLIYFMDDHEDIEHLSSKDMIKQFNKSYANAVSYNKWLGDIAPGNKIQKSQFVSCLNCGISSYKEMDNFKGFFAGINYQTPARTYYRDGYFTAISVLKEKPKWVANQIQTLILGIAKDGSCPSAVINKDEFFWANHLDAPQFLIILIDDYIKSTRDIEFLSKKINGKTVSAWAEFLGQGLIKKADSKGLIYREAGNRHDWADNVYREGYVTYIQALYCKSMFSLYNILDNLGSPKAIKYKEQGKIVSKAIEDNLWCEEKGWYINYISENCKEDNLSIDTVLLAWFDVVNPERAKCMLKNMENILETWNNFHQPFGDWGTMCVYPPYKYKHHLVEKSSYDFSYHNGSDWPYFSSVYALAKQMHGLDGTYPATRWFTYSLEQGWSTPVEYYSPTAGAGSNLQGWSAMGALAIRSIQCEENNNEQ